MTSRSIASQDQTQLATLIGRCALRDQKAFLSLYDATSAKLFGVVLRIVNREYWAEEVVQDVYLKVWNAADSYNASRGQPMTWLINIARNRAIDFLRSAEHAAAQRSDLLDETLPSALDPLKTTETGSEMERLRRCLEELNESQRLCVLKIYHHGYTPTEVSRNDNRPIGTVKTWVRRGLEQIRKCMRR